MSDARWFEVGRDFASAERHFRNAVALYERGGFSTPGLDGYQAAMAFMHSMQAGHTSMESGLVRMLQMVGEEVPSGERWHADLIRRLSAPGPGRRPRILDDAAARAADLTRRFRNVAARTYDDFDPVVAGEAVKAARELAGSLQAVLASARAAMDPD